MLATCPNPKLLDHTLSAFRGCLFNLFASTLRIRGRSSIRNLRTPHGVVTGTHLYKIVSFIVPLGTAALVGYAGADVGFLCGKTGEHRDNMKRTFYWKQTPDCHLTLSSLTTHYSVRTAPLTSEVSFHIFIQQIQVLNILNMVYTLRISLFKMQFVL